MKKKKLIKDDILYEKGIMVILIAWKEVDIRQIVLWNTVYVLFIIEQM